MAVAVAALCGNYDYLSGRAGHPDSTLKLEALQVERIITHQGLARALTDRVSDAGGLVGMHTPVAQKLQ